MDVPFFHEDKSEAVGLRVVLNDSVAPTPSRAVPLEIIGTDADAMHTTVRGLPAIREAVREFIRENCVERMSVTFVAGRGKLVADIGRLSGKELQFRELVHEVHHSLQRAERSEFRTLSAEELSKRISMPSVEML